jgi:hypothetical protein
MAEETPEEFEHYLTMTPDDFARIFLCLLIEDTLRRRLASFRHDLPAKPVERFEEFGVVRRDVMLVGDGLR